MAQLMEYAEYLSKEIGPRPAGTEEEQQAALYITEQFQKDAGFTADIEEFTSSSNIDWLTGLPGAFLIVVAILGMIFPILAVPAFIIAAAAAAIYAVEAFGNPVISRSLAKGASQNVVAKYQPGAPVNSDEPRGRTRKIILMAHYDSGKVTPGLVRTVESLRLPIPIGLLCVCAMVLAAFFMLIHIFVNTGIGNLVVNVLTIICLVVCAYPVLRVVLYRGAPYNEGANNNASGTAALLEVARRIARGSVSEADLQADPSLSDVRIHGEAAAIESGLVPEGAQIRYEAERILPPEEIGSYSEEERLLSAKAAIAALTGQPVEPHVFGSAADKLVNTRAHGAAPGFVTEAQSDEAAPSGFAARGLESQAAGAGEGEGEGESRARRRRSPREEYAPAAEAAPSQAPETRGAAEDYQPAEARAMVATASSQQAANEVEGYTNAPSWFVAAQQNAKKPASETGPIQRSRYADAIESAEREAAERERERAERESAEREAALKARHEEARAAIEASVAASRQQGAENADDAAAGEVADVAEAVSADAAAAAAAPAPAETPDADILPAFVPYIEAHPEDVAVLSSAPADDDFAASLGSTTAFDPRKLEELAEIRADAQAAEDDFASRAVEKAPRGADADAAADAAEADDEAASEGSKSRHRSSERLASLPSISGTSQPVQDTTSPSRSGMFRKLRTDVPSMSGVIRMQAAGQDVSQPPVTQQKPAPRRPVAVNVPEVEPRDSRGSRETEEERPAREDRPSREGRPAPRPRRAPQPEDDSAEQTRPLPEQHYEDDYEDEYIAEDAYEEGYEDGYEDDYAEDGYEGEYDDYAEDDYEDGYEEDYDDYDDHEDDYEEERPARPSRRESSRPSARSGRVRSRSSRRSADADDVEMPKSRAGGFFSRLFKKDNDLEETPQEWLDVDEDFDARTVGRERGGWESFRDDAYDEDFDEYEDYEEGDDYVDERPARRSRSSRPRRRWEGGSFSRVRLGRVSTRSGEEEPVAEPEDELLIEGEDDQQIVDEIEQIYHFRNPFYNTEIWFVALGSEVMLHDGVKAFMAEHEDDLRGAMVIEVESLGAGDLCTASAEGHMHVVNASSRIKRYMRPAVAATGINPGTVDLSGTDSASSLLQAAGHQSMHLLGVEDGRPALAGSADDVLENVDDLLLDDNVNFLMELLKK